MSVTDTATARLVIDLNALAENYRHLQSLSAPAQCAAVVKANAYGLGAVPVAETLAGLGCSVFFVATPEEGRALRKTLPKVQIYVLDGLFPGTAAFYGAHDLRPVLGSAAEIAEWQAYCQASDSAPPAALHLDTGMNRLGMGEAELATLTETDPLWHEKLSLSLIMSHLACADEPSHPLNETQRQRFAAMRQKLPASLAEKPASLANSAGIFLGAAYHYDLVRPGIALYGGRATQDKPPLAPVAHLFSRILQIRKIPDGETVGYGAAHRLVRPRRIATVPVGYADGYFRALGASDRKTGAHAIIGGYRAPLVGRVSMDLITLDVTHIPETVAFRGAQVELLGAHVPLAHLADRAGTIDYEILTALGARYQRSYRHGL